MNVNDPIAAQPLKARFNRFGARQQLATLDLAAFPADFTILSFPRCSEPCSLVTLAKSLPSLLILTASVVIHSTSRASSALLLAHLGPIPCASATPIYSFITHPTRSLLLNLLASHVMHDILM